jgi:N-acetyl-gamma-glutamylphosphate reductase
MTRKALIVGASGLVGDQLLDLLLHSADYSIVTALLRRPEDIQHPALTQLSVDFEHLDATNLPQVDDVFCCLGTTIRQAEDLAGKLMQAMSFLMPKKYRPVAAHAVTQAMLTQTLCHTSGFHIIDVGS